MTKSDVPELAKNGRVMHISTHFPVGIRVGIARVTQFFHAALWKSLTAARIRDRSNAR